MEVSSWENHLFLWAILYGYVSHNQRVPTTTFMRVSPNHHWRGHLITRWFAFRIGVQKKKGFCRLIPSTQDKIHPRNLGSEVGIVWGSLKLGLLTISRDTLPGVEAISKWCLALFFKASTRSREAKWNNWSCPEIWLSRLPFFSHS